MKWLLILFLYIPGIGGYAQENVNPFDI